MDFYSFEYVVVFKQRVQDGYYVGNSCVIYSGIKKVLSWHVNILKYSTVIAIYSSNVFLP